MTDSAYRLILHPRDPHAVPDRAELLRALRDAEFVGDAWEGAGEGRYRVGDRFFHHVVFLGCSPRVELEPGPGGGERFTHIELSPPLPEPLLFSGEVGSPPRCRGCRHRLGAISPAEGERLECPGCGRPLDLGGIDWRHGAGGGRLLLSVWGIHPHEAVPSDPLLDLLRDVLKGEWDYFYSRR